MAYTIKSIRLMANLYLLGLMWMFCLAQGQSMTLTAIDAPTSKTENVSISTAMVVATSTIQDLSISTTMLVSTSTIMAVPGSTTKDLSTSTTMFVPISTTEDLSTSARMSVSMSTTMVVSTSTTMAVHTSITATSTAENVFTSTTMDLSTLTTESTSSDDRKILIMAVVPTVAIILILIGLAMCIGCILLMCKSRQHTKLKWNEPKLEMSPVLKTKPTSLEMDDRAVFDDSLGSRDSEEHESSSLLSDKTFNGPDISVVEFSLHVKEMHKEADEAFEEEYKSISDGKCSWSEGVKASNEIKNRFTNIFPFDYCRVKLATKEALGSNYINASWINGYKRDNAYIATQGPLQETIGDFWRMIWEYKLPTIVMVTKLVEVGQEKCQQYWPKTLDEYMEVGNNLCVTLKETKPYANYEIRILTVKNVAEPEMPPLKVLHCYYLGWPDHGVPRYATSLLGFLKRVRKSHPYSGPPLLIHCSAGVGRTGTLIVLDIMLQNISQERTINVYECVKGLRQRRCQMVQTMSQYMFIHDALDELITCGETEIVAINLLITMKHLKSTSLGKSLSAYEEQFELLQRVSHKPSQKDYKTIEQIGASSKNRYPNKIPYVPYSCDVAGSTKLDQYINASYIDGYMQKKNFVATQAPLANTIVDFWKMVWKTESKTIVMLCNLQENGKEASSQYWPERVDECQEYGRMTVKFLSEEIDGDITKRRLDVTSNDKLTNKDSHVLTQFHYTDWNDGRQQPSAASILQLNNFILNLQKSTGNKPMIIMCSDGCGRTGTFLSIYSQIDRLKVEAVVDVFQCVKAARIQRMDLVGTVEQYMLIHEVLKEYMTSFDNNNYKNFV